MTDEATGTTGKEAPAEENAAQATATEATEQSTADGVALDTGNGVEAGGDEQVADAQAHHDETGVWPEDTPKWVKERVNKTTRDKYKFKNQAKTLADENAELKLKLEKLENAPPPLGDKPVLESFETEEEFFDKLSNWNYQKNRQEELSNEQVASTQTAQDTSQTEKDNLIDAVMDKGIAKNPKFIDIVHAVPADIFTPEVVDLVVAADNGDDILLFLAENLVEAETIANMNGAQRSLAVGALSVRLATPSPKKPSEAPDPITPGGTQNNGPVADSKLTDKEWFAKRDQEKKEAVA